MKDTIIYLVRHTETVDENGIRNTSEDSQIINEKEILSVEGEEQAKKLSENDELKNLDIIWSSSYTRAKATAKYIANVNDLPFNLDDNLSERKLGNLKELGEFMKDKNTRDPSQEQLLDRTFRTSDGECSYEERMTIGKLKLALDNTEGYETNKIVIAMSDFLSSVSLESILASRD